MLHLCCLTPPCHWFSANPSLPSLLLIPAVSPGTGVGGNAAGRCCSHLANHLLPSLPPFRATKEPLEKKGALERGGTGLGWDCKRRVGREGVRQKIFLNLHIKKHSPLDSSMLFSVSVWNLVFYLQLPPSTLSYGFPWILQVKILYGQFCYRLF